ncbi:MAG: hypothetical protein ACR2G3_05990 [Solirubrobacterales bacterium]
MEQASKVVTSFCPVTGIKRPECSCPDCLTEQIRRFQPGLLEAEGDGEIRITRASSGAGRTPGARPHG